MIALVAMLAIAGPPEQSLDRVQIEAAKLRQLLELERCAAIAPCPRQHACPACETCPAPEPCPSCPPCKSVVPPVVKALPTWIPVVVAAVSCLALGVIAGGVL